jgi:hypothetical protein
MGATMVPWSLGLLLPGVAAAVAVVTPAAAAAASRSPRHFSTPCSLSSAEPIAHCSCRVLTPGPGGQFLLPRLTLLSRLHKIDFPAVNRDVL